jgi:hypothetical protein
MDEILSQLQRLDQQSQNTLQQHELLKKQIRNVEKVSQCQDRSSPERIRQDTPHAFGQFLHAQYCVQAVLAKPPQKLPIPRLFILLPVPTAIVDGQGESQLQFRLYFLCECGAHTTAKDCCELHEVHLANHPGYDLINQDEFINKYGPYLLAMMYMIKFGAKSRGLVVPPLLRLNNAIGDGGSLDQVVDDTISHLKDATRCIDGDTKAQQYLDVTGLAELKSHLKIKDGEDFSGGLSRMKTQNAHYPWICRDHLREYYELTLQELKCNINNSRGVWSGNEIKVNVASDEMVKTLYDNLSELFRIQSVENWQSITGIDLKVDSHQTVSDSTTDILGSDVFDSMSLDFDRLTMSAKNISRGELKDVTISIRDLGALRLEDMEFVHQCRPITLAISKALQEKDDNRLVSILQRSLSITSLRIECEMKRFTAVIDLVKSTRLKLLQTEDKPALRILELVHPEIKVKVSFEKGSTSLDVETRIKMENCRHHVVDPALYTFVRQYGWSVTSLDVPDSFSDRLAKLLDESIQEKGSSMAHIGITPTSLTTPGLDAISRIINQSQGLTHFRLSLTNLNDGNQKDKALLLLGRHKDRLTDLLLNCGGVDQWLPQIARAFPERGGFPVLEKFVVECGRLSTLDADSRQWIVSMVSAQTQTLIPVKAFGVKCSDFWSNGFEALINAIDLSTLEELYLKNENFSHDQLKLLVDRVANYGAPSVPLRLLHINGEKLDNNADTQGLIVSLREKVPEIKITGMKA